MTESYSDRDAGQQSRDSGISTRGGWSRIGRVFDGVGQSRGSQCHGKSGNWGRLRRALSGRGNGSGSGGGGGGNSNELEDTEDGTEDGTGRSGRVSIIARVGYQLALGLWSAVCNTTQRCRERIMR